MFDVASPITYKNVPNRFKELDDMCQNIPIPIALCGNKIDENCTKLKGNERTFQQEKISKELKVN